jgi:hypothetical protein
MPAGDGSRELTLHCSSRESACPYLGDHDEVMLETSTIGMPPEHLTKTTLEEVADNGPTDLATHGDPEPSYSHTRLCEENEGLRPPSASGATQ